MVKRSIEQNLRTKNFEARKGRYETSAVVKNQRAKQREQRCQGDCGQWQAFGQCSKGDNCSFRHDVDKRAKSTQPNPSPRSSTQQNVKNTARTKSPRGRNLNGKMARLPCKDYLKGTSTTPFCKNGILWSACSTSQKKDANLRTSECSYTHRQVDEHTSKKSQKHGDRIAVAIFFNTQQLGCVSQDMEPPKSSSILRKSSTISKPIRHDQLTKAVLRHANIRHTKLSLGVICPGNPYQRNPNAPKFEDRSQEETDRQERYAREAAWKMARSILKLKEKHKTTFFSQLENWCLPSPSTIKPEEREFVVDSGASMHMISKKDLNSAELETVTTSRSPMTVITADAEVQTNEEATVYVKDLDIFLTVKLLEDTPAVLSLGKLCEEHGYSYEWISGHQPHLI